MESLKVKDHMNHRPVYFKGNETIVEAVERLMQSKNSGGPVVNEEKLVIGFLSEQDCLKAMISSTYHSGESNVNVSELMHKDVLAVKPYDSILQIAENMANNKPRVYPVIDDDNHLLGVIDRSNIIKALDLHLHAMYEQGVRFV